MGEPDRRSVAIADAVLRITAREGLDAVSIRTVAAEAGSSVGMVQRQFGSKDNLLLFAMRRVVEQVGTRIGDRIAALGPQPDGRDLIEVLLLELLTAGPEHRDEGLVWLAFLARAVVVPALAEELRGQYEPGTRAVRDTLATLGLADASLEAVSLIALADGLTAHVLLGRIDLDTARRAIRTSLDRLFGV